MTHDDPLVRKTVSLPASIWQKIEDAQFESRLKRESETVRRLIALGLAAYEYGEAQGEDAINQSRSKWYRAFLSVRQRREDV